MAIARKPRAATVAPSSSEREIEALIRRGGSVAPAHATGQVAAKADAAGAKAKDPATANVVLRVPAELLAAVDALVEGRRPRIPRHTWLLEAILEKAERDRA